MTVSLREHLLKAIAALEAQRAALGDAVVDAALAPLRAKLDAIGSADHSTGAHTGERKQVTVMFADLSGFTALSESLDPEHVRNLMNGCFDALVPVVEKYGGVVDKFIGDEIMALFGAPAAHENDAEGALCAALDMIEALADFNAKHRVNLAMHFGIATGRVVAGGLGSEGLQRYSVMGDAVNLAARLAELSETGQILVGPLTHRLTAPLFRFDPLTPVRIKGKADPVAVYRLLDRRPAPGARHGIVGLHSQLVGREAEMNAILGATNALAQGIGGVLTVTGEAGLGKSRLLIEARRSAGETIRWVVGRAAPHTQGTSYALAASMLDSLIGTAAETSRRNISLTLREFVLRQMHGKLDDVYPYLARMREVPPGTEYEARMQELLPQALQGRIRTAFGELVRASAAQAPLVLIWEDVHWADPSSLDLLDSLAQLTAAVPLLLLLVFRPDEGRVLEWQRKLQRELGARYRTLELSPLSQADGGKLIENLLRTEDVPVVVRDMILSKSEGNPFFLEELVRTLIDAGLVRSGGGGVIVTEAVAELQVPNTVESVVAARIDRLPRDAKRVLQTASVIGRLFPRSILEQVLRGDDGEVSLGTTLGELLQRELVLERGPAEYVFKHAITRDVAYESLLIARRKQLHRRTAETMEAAFPEQLDELAPTLAHHLVAGEAREKAIHYLTRSADRARGTYANSEAIAFYRTAIEQVDALWNDTGRPEELRQKAAGLQENVGQVLSMTGRVEGAVQAFAAARSLVPEPDAIAHARLYRLEGAAFNVSRRLPEAAAANERAALVLGSPRDDVDGAWWQEWIDLQIERLWNFYVTARMPDLANLIAEARPVIEKRGTPTQQARLFESLVLTDLRRHRYYRLPDETLENARHALEAAEASGGRRAIGRAKGALGFVHLWRDELPDAERLLQASMTDAELVGDVDPHVIAMNYLALIGRKRGDVPMARLWAERTHALAQRMKTPLYCASALGSLGWVALREGNDARARTWLEEATGLGTAAKSPLEFMFVGPSLALATKNRDWAAAVKYAQTLLHPSQQKLPDAIQGVLEEAVKASSDGAAEPAWGLLAQGVELLRQHATGYV